MDYRAQSKAVRMGSSRTATTASSDSSMSSDQRFSSTYDLIEQSLSPMGTLSQTTPRGGPAADKGAGDALLSWDGITYSVKVKEGKETRTRTLLHGLSGAVYPGEVVGLLGPSGAGKTTLLNTLAGRIEGGVLSGRIQFRGKKRVPGTFRRKVAYVEQEDLMFPMLSVEETIMFAARLRLAGSQYTQLQKIERVASVIQQLRLTHVKGTRIGDALNRGVSGGERKRVSIGVGLVTDPELIVLDEPTSGLDSNSAEMVVELVRDITKTRGIASVMTVHQPSARMLECFDRVLLVSQGHLVYFGSAASAIEYFEARGYPCPLRQNPADFFIDLMSLNNRSPEELERSRRRIAHLAQAYASGAGRTGESQSSQDPGALPYGGVYEKAGGGGALAKGLEEGALQEGVLAGGAAYGRSPSGNTLAGGQTWGALADDTPPERARWAYELRTLVHRDLLTTLRNFSFVSAIGLNSVMVLVLLGLLFFKLGTEVESIQNRIGLFFAVVMSSTYSVMSHYLFMYFRAKDIMVSERGSGSYRMSTYYLSKLVVYLPVAVLSNWLYFLGVYLMAGLQTDPAKVFTSLMLFTIVIVVTLGVTLFTGSFVDSYDLASVLTSLIVTTWVIFGGHLANAGDLMPAIKWMQYISPVYYIYSGMVQTEFEGLRMHCSSNNGMCIALGEDVIKLYKLDKFSIAQCAAISIGLAVAYNILAYLSLRWKAKPKYLWV